MLWIAVSMSGNKKGENEESVLEKLYDKNTKRYNVQTSRRNWRSDKFNKASKIRGTIGDNLGMER